MRLQVQMQVQGQAHQTLWNGGPAASVAALCGGQAGRVLPLAAAHSDACPRAHPQTVLPLSMPQA